MPLSNPDNANKTFAYDELDLLVDGGTADQDVSVDVSKFSYITRVIIEMRFTDNSYEWGSFGDAAELTSGLQFFYNDGAISRNITDNGDFMAVAYDAKIEQDQAGTKVNVLSVRWTFAKASPPYGLDVRNSQNVYVKVKDDLTASPTYDNIIELKATFQGFKFS